VWFPEFNVECVVGGWLHFLGFGCAHPPFPPTSSSPLNMSIKVGINGFGRIGRLVLRCAAQLPNIEIVGKFSLFLPSFLSSSYR
jgi:hypothetical protein